MRLPATSGQDPSRKQDKDRAEDLHADDMAQPQTRPGIQARSKVESPGPTSKVCNVAISGTNHISP